MGKRQIWQRLPANAIKVGTSVSNRWNVTFHTALLRLVWSRPDLSMEELLNLTSDPESKSGLEILRQCHWRNRGHKIKACSGPLVMGISSGVSNSIKVLISINWFLHQRCNIKLWISNVHILSYSSRDLQLSKHEVCGSQKCLASGDLNQKDYTAGFSANP